MADEKKYLDIWINLPSKVWFTAKEVNLAPATLTAMRKRGLVKVDETVSPRKYQIVLGNANVLVSFYEAINSITGPSGFSEFPTAYYKDCSLGDLLTASGGKWCHGKTGEPLTLEEISRIVKVSNTRILADGKVELVEKEILTVKE